MNNDELNEWINELNKWMNAHMTFLPAQKAEYGNNLESESNNNNNNDID